MSARSVYSVLTACGALCVAGCSSSAPAPVQEPEPETAPRTVETTEAPPAPEAPEELAPIEVEPEPEPAPEPEGPERPGWFQDGSFEYEGRNAVSASADGETVRDARRAAVDAAVNAFRRAFPGERPRVERTTPAVLPDGTFRVFVLTAADPEADNPS